MSALGIFGALTFLGAMTGITITIYVIAKEMLDLSLKEKECKHEYEHYFIPFADQPFEDDDCCCVEGEHVYRCINCGEIVKYANINGKNIKTGL